MPTDNLPSGNLFEEGILDTKSGKKYATAIMAMLECEHFEDLKVYTDFKPQVIKPQQSLSDLYKERITSLREKYDYIELSWGGGHDSTMILKASEQAGCAIDTITMQVYGDPKTQMAGFNSEISHNLHHVDSYLRRFPGTNVRYLDIDESYKHTITHHHDHQLWCRLTTMEMLDDVCRIGTDHLVPERNTDNGAIISGQGWKNVIHNREHGTWSMFFPDTEINQLGGISLKLPTVRFYETGEIMTKVANDIRDRYESMEEQDVSRLNITGDKNLWVVNNEWVHEEIMYTELKGEIFHEGKSTEWVEPPWQESPRFSWWIKNPNARHLYKEYYQWISMLNQKVHPSCLQGNGGILVDGRKNITAAVIDF